jgi:hypothetical protein
MKTIFFIEDGKGYGEGIVIKNYSFKKTNMVAKLG